MLERQDDRGCRRRSGGGSLGGAGGVSDSIGQGPSGRPEQEKDRALDGLLAKEGCTGTVRGSRPSALVSVFVFQTGLVRGGSTGGEGTRTCSIERIAWSKSSGERVCLGLWLEKGGAGGVGPEAGYQRNHLEGDAPPPQTNGRSRGWFVRETTIVPFPRPGAGLGDGERGKGVVPEPIGGGEETLVVGHMEEK